MTTNPKIVTPTHDCGMCDEPLTFDGYLEDATATFKCASCGWVHIARDCCEETNR